jgi:membrane protein implicated in regulation of membrane protease activity
VYLDAHPRPVFPRWVAPFNIVTALAILPSALAATVTTGPLAWNGAISFYLRISAFAVYILVMFVVVRAAVIRQSAEEADQAVQP